MYKVLISTFMIFTLTGCGSFNVGRLAEAGTKVLQASTISDEEVAAYARSFIRSSDSTHQVCSQKDPYAIRLNKIAGSFNHKEGINIQVYRIKDIIGI